MQIFRVLKLDYLFTAFRGYYHHCVHFLFRCTQRDVTGQLFITRETFMDRWRVCNILITFCNTVFSKNLGNGNLFQKRMRTMNLNLLSWSHLLKTMFALASMFLSDLDGLWKPTAGTLWNQHFSIRDKALPNFHSFENRPPPFPR